MTERLTSDEINAICDAAPDGATVRIPNALVPRNGCYISSRRVTLILGDSAVTEVTVESGQS